MIVILYGRKPFAVTDASVSQRSRVTGFEYEPGRLRTDLGNAMEQLNWRAYIKTDSSVFVKPNFTLPFYKPGVTTSHDLLEASLGILKDRASEVFVGESDGGYSSFSAKDSLRNHGIPQMCKRTGATMLNLSEMDRIRVGGRVNGKDVEITLPRELLGMDETVSLPVMKVHVVTRVSLSLKNVWGCHPDTLRLLDHTRLAERLALMARSIHLRFAVIDAIVGLDMRGPMVGDPVRVGAILVGDNPVATDATAARLMGFSVGDIEHIKVANAAGLGPMLEEDIDILGDLTRFQQGFSVQPTLVDRLGTLTFKSEILTKLVFDSVLTKPIYALMGRSHQRKIAKPGDEL